MVNSKTGWKPTVILAADVVNFRMMMGDNEDQTLKNRKTRRLLAAPLKILLFESLFRSFAAVDHRCGTLCCHADGAITFDSSKII